MRIKETTCIGTGHTECWNVLLPVPGPRTVHLLPWVCPQPVTSGSGAVTVRLRRAHTPAGYPLPNATKDTSVPQNRTRRTEPQLGQRNTVTTAVLGAYGWHWVSLDLPCVGSLSHLLTLGHCHSTSSPSGFPCPDSGQVMAISCMGLWKHPLPGLFNLHLPAEF